MKNKIHLAIFLALYLCASCKKNELSKTEPTVTIEPEDYPAIRESAFESMNNILNHSDLYSLNWDAAEIVVERTQRTVTVTVISKTNPDKKLVYLHAGDIKLYQWDGEVHAVPSN